MKSLFLFIFLVKYHFVTFKTGDWFGVDWILRSCTAAMTNVVVTLAALTSKVSFFSFERNETDVTE